MKIYHEYPLEPRKRTILRLILQLVLFNWSIQLPITIIKKQVLMQLNNTVQSLSLASLETETVNWIASVSENLSLEAFSTFKLKSLLNIMQHRYMLLGSCVIIIISRSYIGRYESEFEASNGNCWGTIFEKTLWNRIPTF